MSKEWFGMSKKILIHSHTFSPDGVSTAYIYSDIALKFKEEGYIVSVLTSTPHYNVIKNKLKEQPLKKKWLGLYYESDFQGIKVKHVYQKKYKNTTLRLIGFLYWHIVSFFIALFEKKIDVILSPSPPLTLGFLNILIGKIKRAKVIYNVQEIYPDLLIKQKGLRSKSIIAFLQKMERIVYNSSNAVTTIDQVFYDTIIDRFKDSSKLHIIPNFVDTDIYHPINPLSLNINEQLFPETSSLKLMYAGNIGYAQDWQLLIELAEELKNEQIEFFIIGEGVMNEYLKNETKKRKLNKIHILPYQPRELMPSLLAYSDIQFIFMSPETERDGFPSKVYTIMACARPLLVCSGYDTPIVNFLSDKDCAYIITEKDIKKKVENAASILRNISSDDLIIKGKRGYDHIINNYTKHIIANKYVNLVDKLLDS